MHSTTNIGMISRPFSGTGRVIKQAVMACLGVYFCLLHASCSNDSAPDCFQRAGGLVRQEVVVADFSKITVFEKITLVIKQGDVQKVEIETGEYLREEVSAVVTGDRLILRNENGCNLFRAYGVTKVFVTAPDITEIRSSTGLSVRSDGALTYPELTLFCESFNVRDSETTDGEFDLELASESVSIVVNGIAYFKLRGTTDRLDLTIAAGDSRIEADNLVAQTVSLNHRGSNDMIINPQMAIQGVIRGTGDVISLHRPEEVNVEEVYRGRLIFR